MRILSLHVQNFLSFGKAAFDLHDAGLVLVEGENRDDESARSNGSGKSAMIDALVWCLFGTTLRGYENDEVINRKVGEDCCVVVHLHDGDVKWAVTRARRHSQLKNALKVLDVSCGVDHSKPSVSETQEVVEKLLGCSRRTFLSSVVFGQDRAYRFSSLTDKEQKEILDEVLGVERFALACNAARARSAVLTVARDTIRRNLDRAEEARDATEEEVDDLHQKHASFATLHEEKLDAEQEKLAKAKKWLKENGKVVDVDKLRAASDKVQKTIATYEKEIESKTAADTRAKVALSTGKSKADELWTHILRHEQLVGDCPTCGQGIDEKKQATIVKGLREKHTALQVAYVSAEEASKDIASGLVEAKRKLKEAREKAMVAMRALNDGIVAEANVTSWRRRAKDSEERIAELKAEENPYAKLAKKAQARLDKHKAEVELLTGQLATEEARLKTADFWVKAFGARGLRSLLLDSSLPVLNAEAERVSNMITGGAITVEFSATSELKSGKTIDRFEVKVDNKHGAGSYQGNSAGEKAKVDLCVGLALQRLVASRSPGFNVCFFDEVFDHLDSAAHERVVEVLAEIDKESVFVVSHDEDLKAWFPASLKIVKEDGYSKVET